MTNATTTPPDSEQRSTEHTPGLWRVVTGDTRDALLEIRAGDQNVCSFHCRDQQNEANAHLIAVAPRFLDAIHACIEQMEQCEKMFWDDTEFQEALRDARAVVAEAKGLAA